MRGRRERGKGTEKTDRQESRKKKQKKLTGKKWKLGDDGRKGPGVCTSMMWLSCAFCAECAAIRWAAWAAAARSASAREAKFARRHPAREAACARRCIRPPKVPSAVR